MAFYGGYPQQQQFGGFGQQPYGGFGQQQFGGYGQQQFGGQYVYNPMNDPLADASLPKKERKRLNKEIRRQQKQYLKENKQILKQDGYGQPAYY